MLTFFGNVYSECFTAAELSNKDFTVLDGIGDRVASVYDLNAGVLGYVFEILRALNFLTMVSVNDHVSTLVIPSVVARYFFDFEKWMDPLLRLSTYKQRAAEAYFSGEYDKAQNYAKLGADVMEMRKPLMDRDMNFAFELAQFHSIAAN